MMRIACSGTMTLTISAPQNPACFAPLVGITIKEGGFHSIFQDPAGWVSINRASSNGFLVARVSSAVSAVVSVCPATTDERIAVNNQRMHRYSQISARLD